MAAGEDDVMLPPGTGPPPGAGSEPDLAMVGFGRTVAVELQLRHGGSTEHGTGWRCALQRASDHSGQDREVLQIADDVYAAASVFANPPVLLAYVHAAQTARPRSASASFLLGMLDRIDTTSDERG